MTQESKKTSTERKYLFTRLTEIITASAVFCIAIGEIDGTIQSANHYYEKVISEFTDTYDYEKLSKIHVGNTQHYLETLFGKPMVAKDLDEAPNKTYKVNYYFTEKYLFTVFLLKERISAYTVLNFKDNFHPNVNKIENKKLGKFALSDLNNLVDYTLDSSASMKSVLQVHEYGRQGFFRKYYYGYIDYATKTLSNKKDLTLLRETANLEMMGDEAFEDEFLKMQRVFKPNLYGEGELTLMMIRKSLLTELEFKSYFSREKE